MKMMFHSIKIVLPRLLWNGRNADPGGTAAAPAPAPAPPGRGGFGSLGDGSSAGAFESFFAGNRAGMAFIAGAVPSWLVARVTGAGWCRRAGSRDVDGVPATPPLPHVPGPPNTVVAAVVAAPAPAAAGGRAGADDFGATAPRSLVRSERAAVV